MAPIEHMNKNINHLYGVCTFVFECNLVLMDDLNLNLSRLASASTYHLSYSALLIVPCFTYCYFKCFCLQNYIYVTVVMPLKKKYICKLISYASASTMIMFTHILMTSTQNKPVDEYVSGLLSFNWLMVWIAKIMEPSICRPRYIQE